MTLFDLKCQRNYGHFTKNMSENHENGLKIAFLTPFYPKWGSRDEFYFRWFKKTLSR